MTANKITGANAGGARRLQIRALRAARIAQFCRSATRGQMMTWGDEADRRERQRRVDAAIGQATACHMSDAKWRKLLAALRELRIGSLRWKFIRDDRIFTQPIPPAHAVLEQTLGDVLPYPYGPFREIVEIPTERAAGVVQALTAVGHFPIQQLDSGVRVVGYTW